MRQRDIGALRKDRMIFQERPEAGEIVGADVVDPEDRMRIAHADHRRRMQHRRVDRADLQFDRPCVAKLFRQRNILPAEFRRAHVDGVEIAGRALPAIQQPGPGLEGGGGPAGVLEQPARHAAHAVAAGGGFRAVIVVDADEGLGALQPRRLQQHQLVVMHPRWRRHRARLLRRDKGRRIAQIDHDNFVADAVHLGKRMIGERAHGIFPTIRTLYGEARRIGQCGDSVSSPSRRWEAHELSVMGRKHASRVRIGSCPPDVGRNTRAETRPQDTAMENTK